MDTRFVLYSRMIILRNHISYFFGIVWWYFIEGHRTHNKKNEVPECMDGRTQMLSYSAGSAQEEYCRGRGRWCHDPAEMTIVSDRWKNIKVQFALWLLSAAVLVSRLMIFPMWRKRRWTCERNIRFGWKSRWYNQTLVLCTSTRMTILHVIGTIHLGLGYLKASTVWSKSPSPWHDDMTSKRRAQYEKHNTIQYNSLFCVFSMDTSIRYLLSYSHARNYWLHIRHIASHIHF